MADASSIRKTTTPLAAPAVGALPIETQNGAGFYESAIRFQLNSSDYNYSYTDSNGITQKRTTGQAFVNSGYQWVPVGNVVLSIAVQNSDDAIDQNIFIADRAYNVISMQQVHAVAGTDASAVTAQITKCSGTTVPGSGVAVMTNTFNLKGTINTVQTGTLNTDTLANTKLAPGDRLAINFTGVTTAYAGAVYTVVLQPA
jgi:hypothetical protein